MKILIPAIITATVLIAGIFAFMPVEKAGTVHLITLAGTTELQAVFGNALDVDNTEEIRVDCNQPFSVVGLILAEDTNVDAGDDFEIDEIEIDGEVAAAGGSDVFIGNDGGAGSITDTSTTAAHLDGDAFDYFFELTDAEIAPSGAIHSSGAPVDFGIATEGVEGDELLDVTALVLAPSNASCATTVQAAD